MTWKFVALFCVTVVAAIAVSKGGASSLNCTADYQAAVKHLLTLKTACKDAALYDCCQIFESAQAIGSQAATGVYNIGNVCNLRSFQIHDTIPAMKARCCMDSEDNGWLVILRRKADVSQQVNFNVSWAQYESGFGDLNTEFWYGLRNIHCLTERDQVDLRIELKQNDGTGLTWNYGYFHVDGPETNYVLNIGQAEGQGHDAMARHNGRPFSTYDRDNDDASSDNCQVLYGGGWWFEGCYSAQLTGPHTKHATYDQLQWYDGSHNIYFPHVEMKIRPKKCNPSKKESCD